MADTGPWDLKWDGGAPEPKAPAARQDEGSERSPWEMDWEAGEIGTPPEGGFVASAKQSIGSAIKGASQAAADFIPGVGQDNAVKRYGQEVIDANPTAVKSLGDIADNPGTAVKEAVGNAAGSMGPMIGARLLGQGITAAAPLTGPFAPVTAAVGQGVAWLGPAAAAALPSFGGIREQQIKDDPSKADDLGAKARAATGAAAVGAIESKFGPQEWALGALSKEGRAKLAEKFAANTLGGSVAKGAATGAAIEGAEELVQNPIEQIAAYQDPTTAENVQDTLFGGAMGAIGGGVLGGGFGGVSRAMGSDEKAPGAAPVEAGGEEPGAAPLALPAPTYTGTPTDQILQAEAERQNQVDEAQARARDLYQRRDAFDAARTPPEQEGPDLSPVRESNAARLDALGQQEAGEPDVPQTAPPDGGAILKARRNAEIAAGRAMANPDDEILQSIGAAEPPHLAMGINPAAGPLSTGAAIAVDTGVAGQMQAAAQAAQGQPAGGLAEAAQAGQESPAAGFKVGETWSKPAPAQASTGQRWDGMSAEERSSVAGQMGLPPVIARNLPRAGWATLNPDLQARIAKAMAPVGAASEIDAAAHEASTSPKNDLAQPTEAQAKAGNYKKGHVSIGGLDVAIENPEGSTRSGIDPDGSPWSVTMSAHYGYVKRTTGADGDQVDVYIGKADPMQSPVFVVNQYDRKTGKFDEHKAILGASSLEEAQALYDAHFSDGKGAERRGGIASMSFDTFKEWTKSGNTKKPVLQNTEGGAAVPVESTGTRGRAADAAEDLRAMAQDAGWAERGGLLLRDAAGSATGRTKWLPRAEWFMAGMEADPETLGRDIDRFAAGERVPAKSLRTIEGMLDWLDAQRGAPRLDEDASAYDFESAGLDLDASEEALLIGDIFAEAASQDEAAVMRALGFTEEEIQDVVGQKADREGPRGTGQDGAGRAQEAGEVARGDAQPQGEAGSEGSPEGLTSYTNEDIARQESAQRAAAAEAEKAQREADQKAQADAEREAFTLTGSERPADVLAAQGQGGLFDAPAEAKPTNLKDGLAKIRKEKAAQAAAEPNQEPIKNESRADAGPAPAAGPANQEAVKKPAGVKEAPPETESYNDGVRREMREARIRRLQEDRTITRANGKPFKTEASARAFSNDNELGSTHEAVSRDGGFVLQKRRRAADPETLRQEAAFARAEKIGPAAEAAVTAYENGYISIEEFEAGLDAVDQPAVGNAPSPLEALFSDLNSGSTRKANKAKKAAAKLPQAARIDYVQAHFHDILIQMMEAGALEVNGATTLTEDNAPCL